MANYWINTGIGAGVNCQCPSITLDAAGAPSVAVSSIDGFSTSGSAAGYLQFDAAGTQTSVIGVFDSALALAPLGSVYDASGNLFVAAGTGGVVKFNASGQVVWGKTATNLKAHKVAIDSSGNVYVAGLFAVSSTDRVFLLKLDSAGAIVWQKYLYNSTAQNAFLSGLAVSSAGDVYLSLLPTATAGSNFQTVVKFDTAGTVVWKVRCSQALSTRLFMSLGADGAIYAGMHSASGGELVKLQASDGALLWNVRMTSNPPYNAAADASGNVYVLCHRSSATTTELAHIAQLNSSGVAQWVNVLDGGDAAYLTGSFNGMSLGVDGVWVGVDRRIATSTERKAAVVAHLPLDGTGTGTYGEVTYSTSANTFVTGAVTMTTSTVAVVAGGITLVDSTTAYFRFGGLYAVA